MFTMNKVYMNCSFLRRLLELIIIQHSFTVNKYIPDNFLKCPWGLYGQDGFYSPTNPSRGPSNTFGFFILLQAYSHYKFNVWSKIVDKIALSKFPYGSLHGGNPPQMVTVGRYKNVCKYFICLKTRVSV